MNIEELTISEAREIAALFGTQAAKPCPFEVGKAYLIRTVTMAWTGRVVRVVGDFLVLADAAWIPDTGRYSAATSADALSEIEPVDGEAFLGLGAIVDSREWTTTLPSDPK